MSERKATLFFGTKFVGLSSQKNWQVLTAQNFCLVHTARLLKLSDDVQTLGDPTHDDKKNL